MYASGSVAKLMGRNQAHFTATAHSAYLRNKCPKICSSVSVKAR